MSQVVNETPTLAQVIESTIENRLCDLHTCLPAKIISYDGNKAVIQPLLRRKFKDGEIVTLPEIKNVPVAFPRAGKYQITFPLNAGDYGLAFFSERSLDLWLVNGGTISPEDPRKFDLSDAVFYPGLYDFSKAPIFQNDAMVLSNGAVQIKLKDSGAIVLKNGTEELIDLVDQLLQAILDATTNTIFGPLGFNNLPIFDAIKTKLDTLKE